MNGDARRLGRTLDGDFRDAGLGQLLAQHGADFQIRNQELAVFAFFGEPFGIPVFGDTKTDTGRMYFMTHDCP